MLKDRIRKYLPVVLDLETGGLDNKKNPILEIAIQLLEYRDNNFELGELIRYHIEPFKDLEIDPESLEFTKIDLSHPLSAKKPTMTEAKIKPKRYPPVGPNKYTNPAP